MKIWVVDCSRYRGFFGGVGGWGGALVNDDVTLEGESPNDDAWLWGGGGGGGG